MKQKNSVRKRYALICYFILGVVIFILTHSLSYITDDWHFRFIFKGFMPGEHEERVKNVKDIVTSMQGYYQLSGGRVFAHGLLYFVLFLPKIIYDLLNAVIFVTVTMLIEHLSQQGREQKVSTTILLFGLLFLFLPAFGDTCLWTSGATNYLWMSVFPLLFLICNGKKRWVASILLAIICGFTNEVTGGVLAVYLVVEGLLQKETRKGWIRRIVQILCMLPGMLFILTAPGNYNRAVVVNQTKAFEPAVALRMLGRTAQWLLQNYYLALIFVILGMPIFFRKEIRRFLPAIPFFVASIAGMTALALSGTFFKRSQFLNVIFLVIAFVIVINVSVECFKIQMTQLTEKIEKIIPISKAKGYCRILKWLCGILIVVYLGFQFLCFFQAANQDQNRMNQIMQSVKRGDESVTVSKVVHYTAGAFYPEEASISGLYEALWMGLYYGIEIRLML